MTHPWQTVDLESDMGRAAVELVREIDEELTEEPHFVLTTLLGEFNQHRQVIMNWEATSLECLLGAITPEKIGSYNNAMDNSIYSKDYPGMVKIVESWQNHLYEHETKMIIPEDSATMEGHKLMVAHYEAEKLCPGLLTELLPEYNDVKSEYEAAKHNFIEVEKEVEELMSAAWPADKTVKFLADMRDQFPDCEIDLYKAILSVQYGLCQASLDLGDQDSD